MAIKYEESVVCQQLELAAQDMSSFYKQPFANFRGTTSVTREPYTEVVAKWLLEHASLLEDIPKITRTGSYRVLTHNGVVHNQTNRAEEIMAKNMFTQGLLPGLGKVLDYQTPLKDKQDNKAGKIDLLVYDDEKKLLRFLELKKPDSMETMLRCVLEIYTYYRTIDIPKLLRDFSLPADTVVQACPCVFADGYQHREMRANRPWLKQLMALLGITPVYLRAVVRYEAVACGE